MAAKRVRADFIGGPADGQYRIFMDPAPATINWLIEGGVVVYVLEQSGSKYTYRALEEETDA